MHDVHHTEFEARYKEYEKECRARKSILALKLGWLLMAPIQRYIDVN